TVLILTTNIGAELIKSGGGFGFAKRDEEATYEKMKDLLHKEVERHFRPEFINRLDDIIVFKALSRLNLEIIVDYELRKVRQRLSEHGLELELTEDAKEFLIDKGYNPDFGARPLRRAIEHHVEDTISEDILRGNYKGKSKIVVSVKTEETEENRDDEDKRHLYFEACGEAKAEGDVPVEMHEGT
ncbi:MAG: ATP-dependent Clp protease ATP-binding subunit, partial [Phycisphaerae bacterium]|nr:ATP-dependent Clp protease ATP-binding subunit [Phycisphaerae bacterium]